MKNSCGKNYITYDPAKNNYLPIREWKQAKKGFSIRPLPSKSTTYSISHKKLNKMIYISTVKWLIASKIKGFFYIIYVCTVYIYYVYRVGELWRQNPEE